MSYISSTKKKKPSKHNEPYKHNKLCNLSPLKLKGMLHVK